MDNFNSFEWLMDSKQMGRQEGSQTQFDHQAMLLPAASEEWISGNEIGGEGMRQDEVSVVISEGRGHRRCFILICICVQRIHLLLVRCVLLVYRNEQKCATSSISACFLFSKFIFTPLTFVAVVITVFVS